MDKGKNIVDKKRYPTWSDLAGKFSDERDCLAAFLALEGAELFAGVKPGNMVNLVNRLRPCGKNLYTLWRNHGRDLVQKSGLSALELADRGDSLLLFLYRPELLQALLRNGGAAVILRQCGYPASDDPDEVLHFLKGRFAEATFPHEIGIFLGYPLKDVLGFMGRINLPYTCQGPWKMYGDPGPSRHLASRFRHCRRKMARRLAACTDPLRCLRAA